MTVEFTSVSSEAPLGEVSSGWLLARCRVMQISSTWSGWASIVKVPVLERNRRESLELHLDTWKSTSTGVISIQTSQGILDSFQNLWCVRFVYAARATGLLLAKLSNGFYHRVGHFDLWSGEQNFDWSKGYTAFLASIHTYSLVDITIILVID
jgi:hypothetical protein